MNLKFLTSFHLKNIALVTMIIDHIGHIFYPDIELLRVIGRVAFILYAFLLVNGCYHTSNISKYLKKLFVWGLISEIPYDLVFNDAILSLKSQNIFFTLFTGALGIHFYNKYESVVAKAFFLALGVFVAYSTRVDYSWYGVSLIYGLYMLREYKFLLREFELLRFGFIQLLSILYVLLTVFSVQFFAFLGAIPIYLYNGKLGRKAGNIYYSYYAIHLLLFYFIKSMLKNSASC